MKNLVVFGTIPEPDSDAADAATFYFGEVKKAIEAEKLRQMINDKFQPQESD